MTKAETDALIELACSFDLRWPVKQPGAARALRQVEDLKHHHYQVGSLLTQRRVERAMATQLGRQLGHRQSARGRGAGDGTDSAEPDVLPTPVVSSTLSVNKRSNISISSFTSTAAPTAAFPATVTTIQQPQPAPPPPSFATAIPPTEMAAL